MDTPEPMLARLEQSLEKVANWVERHEYRAYDPGDGQLSLLRHFTFNHYVMKRLLTAAALRVPFNIRPFIGTPAHTSTKGMGYMAWGYVKQFVRTGEPRHADRARHCLDWLMNHRAPKYADYCWGNHFDFTTRGGTIPAHEPTIVWSSLIGQAFLEAHKVLGEEKYLKVAASVAQWVLKLPRERTDAGDCLSYIAFKQSSIHNSNMLGAALLGQVGALTGDAEALKVAQSAIRYSCTRMEADGAWFYGEDPKYHWIDNFHTGYNLDSLKRYVLSTGDRSFDGEMQRGYAYFNRTFFEADGRPRYYHDRIYPTDIQCAAQAIDTLTFFSDADADALGLAKRVAAWTITHMQDADGHFYYRDMGWAKNRTPMLHWGQGTMFKALAHLAQKLASCGSSRAQSAVHP